MELTLGPVLYKWETTAWRDFYFRIADEAPVDIVVVGEIVCAKRVPALEAAFPLVLERLRRAGKTVLLGSPIVASDEAQRWWDRQSAAAPSFAIEANDISYLRDLTGQPHAVGPYVNVYNEMTARYLAQRGAGRICLPPELPFESVAAIAEGTDAAVEVCAFGRLPLAISARCYHARLHQRSKSTCRLVCGEDPDGLLAQTMDGERYLAINGVQVLSGSYACLTTEIGDLRRAGVRGLRLLPQVADMVAIAEIYRALAEDRLETGEAAMALQRLCPGETFSNGFLHGVAGGRFVTGSEAVLGAEASMR